MDNGQILSWIVGAVGLIGFYFAGKRVWWSWYINILCQGLWISYALVTGQPAFLVTAAVYSVIFGLNAYKWTKEHLNVKRILKEMTDNKSGTAMFKGVELTYNMIEPEEESNLVKHARHELNLIGEEPEVIDWYVRVINSYSSFGHSGGSAWATTSVLEELLRFRPLTELTDDPDEWFHHGEDIAGRPGGMWQNKRDGRCFSNDGGKTYWNVDDANNPTMKYYDSISKKQWLEDHAHVSAN
jgi:hypothetical protein